MRKKFPRERRATSTIVGGVIILVMGFTILYGYFYSLNQSEQRILQQGIQNNQNVASQSKESLSVAGTLVGPELGIIINNTGISATIVSYQVTDRSTNSLVLSNAGSGSSPSLPIQLGQGQSIVLNSRFIYPQGKTYSILILTSRGTTAVGTYPSRTLPLNVINSLVAAGLGSLSMNFSSYSFYDYIRTSGPPIIDINHPHQAAELPYGVDFAASLQITNNDPAKGNIVVDPHTELWAFEQCQLGCGTFPKLDFGSAERVPC